MFFFPLATGGCITSSMTFLNSMHMIYCEKLQLLSSQHGHIKRDRIVHREQHAYTITLFHTNANKI